MTVKDFRKLLDKMADDAKVTIWTKNNNFIYDTTSSMTMSLP